jgi:N-acetylmuramoyl-L-alanine amidase
MVPDKKFLNVIFLFILITTISGCAGISKRTAVSPKDEASLKDICERHRISWQWDQVLQVVTLSYQGAQARALVGSDLVLFGDQKVTLSAAIRTVQSAVVVPPDFKVKVIDRLYAESAHKEEYVVTGLRRIMIDPGHGGKDPGAIGHSGLQEKEAVLDISRKLGEILRDLGFQVALTREDDRFLSLGERTQIASQDGVDLFVSVHANASPAKNVYGFEAYASEGLDFLDRIENQRKVNEALLFDRLSMNGNDPDLKRIVSDMLYENKLSESGRLARAVVEKSARLLQAKSRGAKEERFFVLRNTLVPAILVEVGFLSNPKEEKLLKTESYRRQVAQSLAEGIMEYVHGTR